MTVRTPIARAELIQRFLDLRPVMERRIKEELYKEIQQDLQSLTIHQLSALQQLRETSLPMRELARRMGVSESAMTATADRLVRQGLVERQSDPADRRVVRLAISDHGAGIVDTMHRVAATKMKKMLAVLSDEQLVQLVGVFETICEDR